MAGRKLELVGGKVPRMRKPDRRRFSAARQDKFLAALADTCNVVQACRIAGVATSTVYAKRERDAAFRARWSHALGEAYGRLELAMLERMMNGTVTTRTRADGSTETIHQYPNQVALQLLRLHRQSASEAQAVHVPEDIDEVRERIAQRLERLRLRMEREAGEGR